MYTVRLGAEVPSTFGGHGRVPCPLPAWASTTPAHDDFLSVTPFDVILRGASGITPSLYCTLVTPPLTPPGSNAAFWYKAIQSRHSR